VSPSARRSAVGLPFDSAELRCQLVFLPNGQVVRNDLLPTNVEKPVENELDFEGGKEPNWLNGDRAAQFEVIRDFFGTGVMFFQLKADSRDSCRQIPIAVTIPQSAFPRGQGSAKKNKQQPTEREYTS